MLKSSIFFGLIFLRNALLFALSMVILCMLIALIPDAAAGAYSERVLEYLQIAFTFSFGDSQMHGFPVVEIVLDRGGRSLFLIGYSILFVLLVSLPLGISTAVNNKKVFQNIIIYPLYLLSSIPVLIWAIMLMLFAVVSFNEVPIYQDYISASLTGKMFIASLPILSLSIGDGMLYDTYRTVQQEVKNLLSEPWIKALKSRGRSIKGHIARGLTEPLVVALTGKLTYLISGAIIVEFIFDWEGIGFLIFDIIKTPGAKDYQLLVASVQFVTVLVITASLIRDLVSNYMNPHLREA